MVVSAVCCGVSAQSYSINWYKVAGGGGVSTGGVYVVNGTIGQHDAGSLLSNGNYSLTGGFWSIASQQTVGTPPLNIFPTVTNTVVISWPSSFTGFGLQVNTSLGPSNWTAAAGTVQDNGTVKFVVVNPATGERFYRLKSP